MIVEVYSDSNISVYRSLSTDQKPLGCPHGSRLVEIDTQKKYIYDGMSSTWNESEESSGGGGQPVDAYTKEQTQALLATKVDKQTGMGLSQENYTSVEKAKLASLAPITYDQVPTSGSSNPVTSNGVYDAVAQKQDVINDIASIRAGASAGATALQQSDVASTYASTGSAPANGKAIKEALDTLDVGSVGGAGSYIRSISETNGKISSTPVNFDTALSSSSTDDNAPTSKTVYDDQQRQEAEIGVLANAGAKNIINNTADASRTISGVVWTKNDDGSMTANNTSTGVSAVRVVGVQGSSTYASAVPIPRGTYTISASGFDLTKFRFALGFFADENTPREVINIYNEPQTLVVESDTARYDFSCVIALAGETMTGEIWYPMIRRAEITDDTFVPYAPTNRSLYDNVFGSGLKIPDSTNLNNLVAPGRHYTEDAAGSASIGNSPYTSGAFYVNVEEVNTDIIQTLWPNDVASSVMYRRTRHQSTWGSWFKFEGTVVTV